MTELKGVKRVIFGKTVFVPTDAFIEVGVSRGPFHLSSTREEKGNMFGIPSFEISIMLRLCHANFPGNIRDFIKVLKFQGETKFNCYRWTAVRTTPELDRCSLKVIKAFVGIDDIIISAYLAGKEISIKLIINYFLQNYKYKGYKNRRFVLDA